MEVPQNRIRFLGNSTAKPPRPLVIPHYFLFGPPFKLLLLFLWYHSKVHTYPLPLPPPRLVFFWNSPFDCLMTASWLATYLLASCVVFYVLGSHQLSGGILVWWPIQCISRKVSLDFSFWFLMRISRILYLEPANFEKRWLYTNLYQPYKRLFSIDKSILGWKSTTGKAAVQSNFKFWIRDTLNLFDLRALAFILHYRIHGF